MIDSADRLFWLDTYTPRPFVSRILEAAQDHHWTLPAPTAPTALLLSAPQYAFVINFSTLPMQVCWESAS